MSSNHSNNYKRKIQKNRQRQTLAIIILILLFIFLLGFLIFLVRNVDEEEARRTENELLTEVFSLESHESETAVSETDADLSGADPAGRDEDEAGRSADGGNTEEKDKSGRTDDEETTAKNASAFKDLEETDIYTFLQGPKAWKSRADWSGAWCNKVLAGQEFSIFGCGLCDLANIYGTLTPYDCSPVDMFHYAREVSKYAPNSEAGAIDWPEMKAVLKSVGITSKLRRKDRSYEKFQQKISESITAIVLISSAYDDTYWQNVGGHYVNIWLYNEEDDTVFLADSGNPAHNRQRIPLRYIYDALKTSGIYQYMLVTEVDENGNTWQHDGIGIRWKKPKYYRGNS